MAAQPTVIQQSELLNRLVLDRNSTDEVGHVDQVWMDPAVHRVLGLVCKAGLLRGRRLVFTLDQIHTLGSDSIVITGQPTAAEPNHLQQLESLLGLEVWSEAGQKIGLVTDCLFDLKTGAIRHYLLVPDDWHRLTGNVYQVAPTQIVSYGKKRVMIYEVAAQKLEVYREGLEHKLFQSSETLWEDYADLTDELRSLPHKARKVSNRTRNQLLELSEAARKRAQLLAEQATETAQDLQEQLQTEAQTWTRQARRRSQSWLERMRERAKASEEPIREGDPYLLQGVKETIDVPAEALEAPEQVHKPTTSSSASSYTPEHHPQSETRPDLPDLDLDDDPWI